MTLFVTLAETSERVGSSAGRLAKIRELAALLAQLAPTEIAIAVHYLSGEMPQGRIGVGPAAVTRAAATGPAPVSTLSITDVDERLTALAGITGPGSATRRAERLAELFGLATAPEQRLLLQLLVGELRQGALEAAMLEAIASAARLSVAEVRRAAMYARDLGAVAHAALLGGAAALARFQLELFVPVAPMLAQTAPDVATALQELGGEAAFEWKMDGARVQVHKRAAEVRIYTRGLNEVTAALPEVVELARTLGPQVLILDGEVIALDGAGRPHAFQITMRRVGRRLDVEAMRAGLPLKVFFFDCLRLEAESIADRPARERFEALARAVPPGAQMPRLITNEEAAASEYYAAALAAGHEGIMAKSLGAPYEAGNRGAGWLKIKRAHTLDLVVLAAEWGHGRRSGKLSNLHLGALDPATGQYVMLGKTFKGLTDAMLEWQTREFLRRETHRDNWTVYLRPELVVEVAFSDLQASTRYPGGLALRLARVKRYRDDKSAAEADTMEAVRRIAAAQSGGAVG
ncbi:MAG: ATP-dependent DNA ligase [Gammaproteobacteria bacterium]|nr:ATP-dependent DNA ligase [Gammaproteobacteria bacterium]